MKRKIDWLIINLVLLAGVTLVIAINLNSRLVEQEKNNQGYAVDHSGT